MIESQKTIKDPSQLRASKGNPLLKKEWIGKEIIKKN
jgi:hypothetical protein